MKNRTVNAGVPGDCEALKSELRDALSPQAVALIVSHLQCVDGDSAAAREVAWFQDRLVELVGGSDALNALFEEVGV